MKLLNCAKIRLVLVVFVVAVVLSSTSVKADFVFGEPTNLGPPVNTSYLEGVMCISPDGLELYFNSWQPGGSGNLDLWVTTRATTQDDWGEPVNLGATVNSANIDAMPGMSADGLELYFCSDRPGGSGNSDIWVTTRATKEDPWATPVNLGPTVNSTDFDGSTSISVDGLSLYFSSGRSGVGYGSADIYVSTRATKDQPWGEPVNLGPTVNSWQDEICPSISADGLQLYFSDWETYRLGGHGDCDIWVATRPTKDAPWGTANLGPSVNTPAGEAGPCISSDGSVLYFSSDRPGGHGAWDIWQAPIIPIVDFNGDGFIDTDDLLIMIDNWDTDESLCDIAPMPWGDGVVNIEDLIVFMEYWEQENMSEITEDIE